MSSRRPPGSWQLSGGVVLLLLMSIAAVAAAIQQPAFRSGVDVATLDVVVVDRQGRPITDLTPGDFIVRVGGQARRVVALDPLAFTTTPTRGNDSGPRQARYFALVVDQVAFEPFAGRGLLDAAREFVAGLQPQDFVSVVTTGTTDGVGLTRDHTAVQAVLGRIIGQGSDAPVTQACFRTDVTIADAYELVERADEPNEMVFDRYCGYTNCSKDECSVMLMLESERLVSSVRHLSQIQASTIERAIASLSGVPGFAQVVVLTPGLYEPEVRAYLGPIRQRAERAGVGVDVFQLATALVQGAQRRVTPALSDEDDFRNGSANVAATTGGRYRPVVGQPRRLFEGLQREVSHGYRLGVELVEGDLVRESVTAEISLGRRGAELRGPKRRVLSVRTRAATVDAPGSVVEALERALARATSSVPLDLTLRTFVARSDDGSRIRIVMAGEAATDQDVQLGYRVMNASGATVAGGVSSRPLPGSPESSTAFALAADVPPGEYVVRVAAADSPTRSGAAERTVSARLRPLGPVRASDIFLVETDEAGQPLRPGVVTVESGASLIAELVAYAPAAAPVDVVLELSLTDSNGIAVAAYTHQARLTGEAGVVRWRVPTSDLEPGQFQLVVRDPVSGAELRAPLLVTTRE